MTAMLFVLLTLIHTIVWGKEPENGYLYYLTAALNDLLIMFVISNLKYTTKLTENLMKISIGFILVNSMAWIIWMARINTYIDCYAAMALYFMAIISLLKRDGIEDGNYKMDWWVDNFRMYNIPRVFNHIKS